MVGAALSVVGSSVVDSHTSPCLCLDALPTTAMNLKSGGEMVLQRNSMARKHVVKPGSLELGSSFIDFGHDRRFSMKALPVTRNRSTRKRKNRGFVIVNELAGQYEDSFEDVKTQLLNYFTYKAVRTVMNQLYEMNPTQYRWHELAERVMITRLHLYGKWVKKCDHAEIYQGISDENLELMRERLFETVIWPSDDNTEKIG
ncbi:hypothetical protein D8674_021969 [Pyrus ussuriensis x Pyrus communis]|uniref:Chaperonin-like RbcX protein n=1 Tax=Pyrus ussuriensis x Pyrus communis TaxID=2448454 RepID=A0A5N5GND8_9ROSA|nr:hypothetical protein D8674_021969 [Pyrus ussuriensis x Pyrus communis]